MWNWISGYHEENRIMNNKKNMALLSLKKKGGCESASLERNYLKEYLKIAPTSLALVRAIECRLLSRIEFKHPLLDIGCGDGLFASLFLKTRSKKA